MTSHEQLTTPELEQFTISDRQQIMDFTGVVTGHLPEQESERNTHQSEIRKANTL